jgi:two-component system sensor histidine kinase YesM
VYTRFFFADIITPLHSVIDRMERVSTGDFSVRVTEKGPTEFRRLSSTFNSMVNKIAELTQQIKEEQKERTKVEIEALRYQLNPHFICNTLNTITMMASIAKVESIRRMTVAFTTVMQRTLNTDDMLVSLDSELRTLESYVYIMKIRFGDTFTYKVEVAPELMNMIIPTMLLQPLVENAILHGMRGRLGGTVSVHAAIVGNYLKLEVRDDGVGMSMECRDSLFDAPRDGNRGFNRIGLYNVRRRILLSFPPPANLEVESYPGEGTVVTIIIPIITMATVKDHDKSFDS